MKYPSLLSWQKDPYGFNEINVEKVENFLLEFCFENRAYCKFKERNEVADSTSRCPISDYMLLTIWKTF